MTCRQGANSLRAETTWIRDLARFKRMQAISSKQAIQELGISCKPDPGKVLISNMPIIDQSLRVSHVSVQPCFAGPSTSVQRVQFCLAQDFWEKVFEIMGSGGLSHLPTTENCRLPGLGPNN